MQTNLRFTDLIPSDLTQIAVPSDLLFAAIKRGLITSMYFVKYLRVESEEYTNIQLMKKYVFKRENTCTTVYPFIISSFLPCRLGNFVLIISSPSHLYFAVPPYALRLLNADIVVRRDRVQRRQDRCLHGCQAYTQNLLRIT